MSPDRPAIDDGHTQVTYRLLADRVGRFANVLRSLGIRRGDRVAYLGPNHPSYFDVLFGSAAVGAILVPVNTRLAAPELEYVLGDSGATTIVVAPSHTAVLAEVEHHVASRRIIRLDGDRSLDRLIESADPTWLDEDVSLDDVAVIMYTSGTTGRPKGAMLSHGNLTWNVVNVLIDHDFKGDDMSLVVAPLFHIAALAMISLPTLVKGGTVLVRPTFDPAGALELIASRGVTQMFGVPTMFNAMAKTEEWEGTDLSGLRSVMCGGAPVPTATIDTYLARGVVFIQGYGMTETSPGLLFLDGPSSTVKAGTAGVPSFFTDVRLVGPDMDDAEPGERGEILAAGPNVMKGYWGRPKETGAAFSDGTWFHTGDVAIVDPDGYYTIVDRTKDIIISGGENIYPAEVEDAILHHPAVAECAVFGVPDERWGEVGRAVVVLREGAALDEPGLLAHLDTRLARYKIPKSVVFTDELPKSGAGKVLKPQLRRRFGAGA
jgi:fatty-acyl-CoA synthase